jgi:mono/diheme cytochrome c family protein|tara:strand:- start:555 stop:968 length:414 start_codon:yes stop_codon:yes gene_type:complete
VTVYFRRQCLFALAFAVVVAIGLTWLTTTAVQAEDAYPKANPFAGQEEHIQEGARLYFKWCVQCHGRHADGVSRFGDYAADLRKFWRGYPEFVRITLEGRVKKRMPPWGGVLDEDEIAQIGTYLETLALPGAKWVLD